jgi:hypothetical protein
MITAWDSHIVRATPPSGMNPHGFFIVPLLDMLFFAIFFSRSDLLSQKAGPA